jgi:hypothetical protein
MNYGIVGGGLIGDVPQAFSVVGLGDFDGDGKADILWRHNARSDYALWLMNGNQIKSGTSLGNMPSIWTVQNTNWK